MTEPIHAETTIGPVHLTVSDLQRSLAFYSAALGLQVHHQANGQTHLGTGSDPLIILHHNPSAKRIPGTTGLYHFAIRVPTRLDLARSLRRMLETKAFLQGYSDHLVSEAIYLSDPDGNGIEIYRDRPRGEWPSENGRLRMATLPLDVQNLLSEISNLDEVWTGLLTGTIIGHIHLKVASISESEAFYTGVMGFELMQRYGSSASFVSAGGYHHHIGLNTWAGVGAPPPPSGAIGLQHFVIQMPNERELRRVADRLSKAGVEISENETGFKFRDPSSNAIVLSIDGSST
jgi:catechol 2,3-dioxygenase